MSVQGSNQSTASPMTRVRSQLECPVCFNIPRDLPLPSCPSGHFVCRPCKTRVRDCPTCRQPMPANMTNSAVGALIEQVEHSCKFSDEGCRVKMLLKDLVNHEKTCLDRTITCPYSGCAQVVKLSNFDSHALENEPDHHSMFIGGGGNGNGAKITFKIPQNCVAFQQTWYMGCFQALDELFHVNFVYHQASQCFVLSIWLAKSSRVASKYRANLVIKGDHHKLCFEGIKVSSVENVPSIEKCIEETGSISLSLQRNLAKNLSVKKQEGGAEIQEFLSVEVSIKKI